MSITTWVKSNIGDSCSTGSLAARARWRRWELFLHHFPDLADMCVLDLGGYARGWAHVTPRPRRVVTLNLDRDCDGADTGPGIEVVQGDACTPPTSLMSESFDLVYSNSLIEHVGGYFRRCQFSDVVHAAADRHWVQTPYRYFPLEPHWLFPLFQFLTPTARAWVAERWSLAHEFRPGRAHAEVVDWVLSVELLSQHEFRHLFSSSTVMFERIAGLPKSMIAVRK